MIRTLAALLLAAPAWALDYHARIEHVPDVRDTYWVVYPARTVTSATWTCRLIDAKRPDADPSGMLAGGPTVTASDTVTVAVLPGTQRAGNTYHCRVRATDTMFNTPTAEILIRVTYPTR
jgi:hypothetical protein